MTTKDKNREKDNFSQSIGNKLANYSLSIEEGSWEELEKRLNAQAKKKISLWPRISGILAAASIAFAFLLLYHIKESDYDNTAQLSNPAEGITKNIPAEENLSSAYLSSAQIEPDRQRIHRTSSSPKEVVFREPDVASTAVETTQEMAELSVNKENTESNTRSESFDPRLLEASQEQEYIPISILKRKTKSIALHISSGGRLYASNNTLNTVVMNEASSGLRYSNISQNAPSSLSGDMLNSKDFSQIAHRPPVSMGLSIQKTLNNYLSIESGLTYSYLYSTFENKAPRRDASLSLHYLGIPVNLAVNLYPSAHYSWNIYFSAGGMVEKGLLSHYVQNIYSPESGVAVTTISNERIKGLQWSVQAAIGISYRLNRDYGIFLEPKVSYYLDNNQPFNARTEHPFMPGINVGLRRVW